MAESEDDDEHNEPVLLVVFYRTGTGNEPVREWYGALVPNVHNNSAIRHYGIGYPLEVRL